MEEWARYAIAVSGTLIAFLALLATLAYRWHVGYEREFQVLLARFDKKAEKRERETREFTARIDKEAEKREQAIQAALERSDRKFETLMARNNELMKELAGITQRTARSEATLELISAGRRPAASKSPAAADGPGTVAAQQLPGEPPAE